jgi:hypothetical protein
LACLERGVGSVARLAGKCGQEISPWSLSAELDVLFSSVTHLAWLHEVRGRVLWLSDSAVGAIVGFV